MRDNNLKEIDLADLHIYSGSKIAIFVHWSKNDVISNHDQELINSLALEFDQVIVICNLNKAQSIEKNTKHNFGKNVKLINRVNSGYDFGGYQAGLAALKASANLIDEIVLVGFVIACLFAGSPILRSPLSANDTIDGVVLFPSEFGITTGSFPSITATHEFVVPKSIPIIFDIYLNLFCSISY